MNPDIIVAWPRNCDYPLWRKFIRENRWRFNEIFVIITETNSGFDYSGFVKTQLEDICVVVNSPLPERGQDWRDVAVNFALKMSQSDYVWFTEQDFYPNDKLWTEFGFARTNKMIAGAYQADRLHPCCILASRAAIEMTTKNFGIIPDVSDHFSVFQNDLKNLTITRISQECYEHLNGLSHNFYQISTGGMPNYEPERFKRYITDSLSCGETIHPEFEKVCRDYLNRTNEKI